MRWSAKKRERHFSCFLIEIVISVTLRLWHVVVGQASHMGRPLRNHYLCSIRGGAQWSPLATGCWRRHGVCGNKIIRRITRHGGVKWGCRIHVGSYHTRIIFRFIWSHYLFWICCPGFSWWCPHLQRLHVPQWGDRGQWRQTFEGDSGVWLRGRY